MAGIITRLRAAAAALRLPGGTQNWTPDWLASIGARPSTALDPSPTESLGVSAVYGAVSLLAGALAASPPTVTRRGATGGLVAVQGTAASNTLADTEFATWESFLFDGLVTGNGYLHKQRDLRGAVQGLEWLPAWRVGVAVSDDGAVWYDLLADASVGEDAQAIPASDVVHLKFRPVGTHRHLGVSPLTTCAPSMGLVWHTRQAGTSIYRNAAFPSVLIKHAATLQPDAILRIKTRFLEAVGAASGNLGTPVVLTEGMTADILDVAKAVDLQLVEMTGLGVREVSRVYAVPAHMLGEAGQTNFASAAESSRSFVATCLTPWAVRVADCLSHSLLTRSERLGGTRVSYDLSSLTRGSGVELADTLSKLTNSGVCTANEARQWIGLGDIEGGETLRLPVNTMSPEHWANLGAPVEPAPPPPPPAKGATIVFGKIPERLTKGAVEV